MTQEVTKNGATTTITNLDPGGEMNPYEAYGSSVSNRNIVGKLLKFSKGDYLVGEDQEELEVGTQLVFRMDTLMCGWIKWVDNKPDEQVMGLVGERFKPPRRAELGDSDEEKWELDNDGKPRDPWQFSNYVIAKEVGTQGTEEDELFTFATSSRGGLNAIADLCKVYGKAMRSRPDENPIVELGVDQYDHKDKRFGRIKIPIFTIVGWEPKDVPPPPKRAAMPPKAAPKKEPTRARR